MYKIGQELTVKEDFKINTLVTDKVMTVKEGDKGVLDSKGFMHITTGNCSGKIVKINDIEVKDYDHENIAKMVVNKLNNLFYDLDDTLDCEGLTFDVLNEEIQDVLENIL